MLRTILIASPVAITYIEEGAVKWTNPAMLKMFGLEREETMPRKTGPLFLQFGGRV